MAAAKKKVVVMMFIGHTVQYVLCCIALLVVRTNKGQVEVNGAVPEA